MPKNQEKVLLEPNSEGNVWPAQCCPAFTPREEAMAKECWYCQFSDFHLEKPKALDVGVCYYPQKPKRKSK